MTTPTTLHGWRNAVRAAERTGELLTATDLAERGLLEFPDDRELQYRAVLALARAGSTDAAVERFDQYGLDQVDDEDTPALRARIAKDQALAAAGQERTDAALHAADLYARIHTRTGGYYPAINAATLSLVGGRPDRAAELATEVLRLLAAQPEDSYYARATAAEAHLLLGNSSGAWEELAMAAVLAAGDHGALSTTRKQLRLICELAGLDQRVLQPLAGPGVAHFCGHIVARRGAVGRFQPEDEPALAASIRKVVEGGNIGYAYGALAAGADIMWAEALLTAGATLHVVLPFDRDEFVEQSVAPAGPDWVLRFDRCLAAASSVDFATTEGYLGDDVLYRYGTELAMGLAVLRSRYLDTPVVQLAVWDGQPAGGAAGTAIDVATWQQQGLPSTIIAPTRHTVAGTPVPTAPVDPTARSRVVRALLFADVKGFSKLTDQQLLRFADVVLGGFAQALAKHAGSVLHQNTWGDALYVVLTDAAAAAACATDLQEVLGALDLETAGLPAHLALRLGGHVGPVYPVHDPVLDAPAFMGSHVSRTARIEPVTPPGIVYVTESFAAALALDAAGDFRCDYVGHMPAAKDYGRLRMYRLRKVRSVIPDAR